MKKIQILGTGCERCAMLADVAAKAANELGLAHEIEKVTDLNRFAEFGVMFTPALVVDGQVKVAGKVPSIEQTKQMLS